MDLRTEQRFRPSISYVNAPANGRPSELPLIDATNKNRLPHKPALLSSVPFGWRGIIVEWHRLKPQEIPEHYVAGHGLAVSTGVEPIPFGWIDGGRRREGRINPGEFHLLTHGELNTPRWLQPFDEISLVLDREFVAHVVREELPADRVEFATQRSTPDAIVARYAEAFRSELETNCGNGLLYADTLTIGLTLHLLSNYGIAKPKGPVPKGKLNSFQLRSVVDFVQSHLEENVSLDILAEQARVSPFHFARQFRATVGVPPHQFVLRQRIQKSIRLMKTGGLPLAQIAVEAGFHDQSHFTRSFRKVLGTTPARYD
jgi:AraC family transcriptional regulator